jgi:hypothetical protein
MKKAKRKAQKASQRPECVAWDVAMASRIAASESAIRNLKQLLTAERNLLFALRVALASAQEREASGQEARS